MSFYNEEQSIKTYTRFALMLICVGALLSLDTFLGAPFVYKFWPVLIGILSVGFIGIYIRRDRREPMFLALGVYLLCFTALALYCNFTSWSTLSLTWPVFITFLGFCFIITFIFSTRKKYPFLLLGLLLVSLSVFFFLVFAISGQLWWTVFILIGISILIAERIR